VDERGYAAKPCNTLLQRRRLRETLRVMPIMITFFISMLVMYLMSLHK
jgi:hypothetical protein